MLTAIYELDVDFTSEKRSKVVLSKGHTVPALYAVLNSKGIKTSQKRGIRLKNQIFQANSPFPITQDYISYSFRL